VDNVVDRPGPRVLVAADWLRDAYVNRGLSLSAISAEIGGSMSTIHRRLKAYGIPTRPRGIGPSPASESGTVLTGGYLTDAQHYGLSAGEIAHRATGFAGTQLPGA
jgi:hypothetical protein